MEVELEDKMKEVIKELKNIILLQKSIIEQLQLDQIRNNRIQYVPVYPEQYSPIYPIPYGPYVVTCTTGNTIE